MKDVQKELIAISTTLSSLGKQMEKIAKAIEKESGKAVPAKKTKAVKKAKTPVKKVKTAAKKAKAAPKKRALKKAAPAATEAKSPTAAGGQTMLESIFGMISRSRSGITVERLKKRTGLGPRQVSNALYKLTQKGIIETLSRGVYIKKKK